MPAPSTTQPAYQSASPCESASITSPAAITTQEAARTPRPPARSMRRPTIGAPIPATSSAHEKAPSKAARDTWRSAAAGAARTAGR